MILAYQRRLVGDGKDDEVGVVRVGRDATPAGLAGRVGGLDQAGDGRQVGPNDDVQMLNLVTHVSS